jgi:hypothetical protein
MPLCSLRANNPVFDKLLITVSLPFLRERGRQMCGCNLLHIKGKAATNRSTHRGSAGELCALQIAP